jgi:Protein of unknown function (DUF3443)
MRIGAAILIGIAVIALASCKGSHKSSGTTTIGTGGNTIAGPASNVATAVVSAGPGPTASTNTLYTSVTVCAPGSTTNCQKIDNIAIDTSTSGLRIIASVLAPTLAAALPLQVDGSGNNIVECMQYTDGFAWGPVAIADMTVSGETAASLPIQIIAPAQFPSPPPNTPATPCAGTGLPLDDVPSLGANGTLGVSVFAQDCGSDCALSLIVNRGLYYACSSATTCSVTTVPVTSVSGPEQVPNPVALFPKDNTGVIVEMPTVAATGASSATGALVFGIDTETNNAFVLSTIVMTVDPVHGYVSAALDGTPYPISFFDTGSKGLFFDAPATDTTLTLCADTANSNYYCPTATLNRTAAVISTSSAAVAVPFSVASADSLLTGSGSLLAFNNLAGKGSMPGTFDWGMPFFYGRNVYFALQGKLTTVAAGPYIAF